ncbi:MAG: arsenical pump-driving ATPase [Planctomycetes bacterium]|nr:arsenical pump-driving ATPase [Planctomycetota bacterium]
MKTFLSQVPRFLFFTGKGGVGKTSMSCAAAVGLADQGKRVLLISTDPASNLGQVLGVDLVSQPRAVPDVTGLDAMNIDPIAAAAEYCERMVGPYRGVLPDEAIRQMEEQLSGACTVEIAGFNEFSKFIGDEDAIAGYDHVVLDTAPTGHTLRLLSLPAAWTDFVTDNPTGSSCLGPVSGLAEQQVLYERVVTALKDSERTILVLVARAEAASLAEAARAGQELKDLGMTSQHVILNGLFKTDSLDPVAQAFAGQCRTALETMPEFLATLPRTETTFRPHGVLGIDALRAVVQCDMDAHEVDAFDTLQQRLPAATDAVRPWQGLLDDLAEPGRGLIMTMGKGGVGKTTMAALVALELARRGHEVHLSTTDPTGHVTLVDSVPNITVSRIDPVVETEQYVTESVAKNQDRLSEADLALLKEELSSPCIEEIAVFQAFARTVALAGDRFVVLDTAPTGHTLLLLDATEAYHRDLAKSSGDLPDEVRQLLPRLRDPDFTRVLIVALPEPTPTQEAAALQGELQRAHITPYGWIINRSFAMAGSQDALLCAKGLHELPYIEQIATDLAPQAVLSPWMPQALNRPKDFAALLDKDPVKSA